MYSQRGRNFVATGTHDALQCAYIAIQLPQASKKTAVPRSTLLTRFAPGSLPCAFFQHVLSICN